MRPFAILLLAGLSLVSSTGCHSLRSVLCQPWQPCYSHGSGCGSDGGCVSESGGQGECGSCGGGQGLRGRLGQCGGCLARNRAEDPNAGMVQGAGSVTYPYYTTRGPRDFLACNPGNIGR